MCAIDGAEMCDIWNVTDVLAARKTARCSECGRDIGPGESYRRIESLSEGFWHTMRLCAHCRVGSVWLEKECGGHNNADMFEDILEHAQEYRSPGLWRLVVGNTRRWQRFDRTGLMPVPALPRLSATPPDTRETAR